MFCEQCGSELSAGSKFCGNCGSAVSSSSAQPPPPPYSPPPPVTGATLCLVCVLCASGCSGITDRGIKTACHGRLLIACPPGVPATGAPPPPYGSAPYGAPPPYNPSAAPPPYQPPAASYNPGQATARLWVSPGPAFVCAPHPLGARNRHHQEGSVGKVQLGIPARAVQTQLDDSWLHGPNMGRS